MAPNDRFLFLAEVFFSWQKELIHNQQVFSGDLEGSTRRKIASEQLSTDDGRLHSTIRTFKAVVHVT